MTKRNRKPERRNEWNDPALAWRARLKFERRMMIAGHSVAWATLEYLFPLTAEDKGEQSNG